jgi:hypothetical protein
LWQTKLHIVAVSHSLVAVQIILLFPYNFWGPEDMFGRLPEACQDRGEYYLFYSYAQLSGAAVLAGLVSGEAALRFEERTTQEATERVMQMLKGLFEPRGISVPAPLQVLSPFEQDGQERRLCTCRKLIFGQSSFC